MLYIIKYIIKIENIMKKYFKIIYMSNNVYNFIPNTDIKN